MTTARINSSGNHFPPVLIAGAGIAGMTAALHLAHLGLPVSLLDSAPAIGGSLHLLDHTFPTNSCGICLMAPKQPAFCPTFECDLHPNLTLLPFTELLDFAPLPGASQDQPAHFSASVRHKPRFVDPELCTGCGLCASVCPIPRPHDFEGWLSPVKAIFRPPGLRAVPDAWLIDMDYCTRCGACVSACPTHAIDLDMAPHLDTLPASALLLTPGFAPFDAHLKGEYGYQVYDNVLSALEFERLVSLAGSTVAHLTRPSDGRPPRRIAFIHCVGSRDNLCNAGYCSSACCMFTAKQVALAKQLDPSLDITVFFMDLRALGKDFEAYLDAVQALPGVSYRRAMPSSVHQRQQSRSLLLSFVGDDGHLLEEEFDLLVLALGLAPPPGMQDLAQRLGLQLNDYGFPLTLPFHPTRTHRPGIFVAGAFREPKDIPDTVAEAAAAAAEIAAGLQPLPAVEQDLATPTPIPLRDLADQQPRIGVFVCSCHGDLDPLQPHRLAAWAADQPDVALARVLPDACGPDGRAAIRAALDPAGDALNRIVLAGCSHRLFAADFEALMHQAGLDPRLLSRVNLRDQVLLPHATATTGLTAKAQSLLAMAIAAARSFSDLQALASSDHPPLTRQALVLGAGAAGLSAALTLARLQIPVHLVERAATPGGQWRHICYQPENLFDPEYPDPQSTLDALIRQVQAEPLIHLHLDATLQACSGSAGHYHATLLTPGGTLALDHGALILATGGQPAACNDYLYGQDPRVLTQRDLELQIADGTLAAAQSVVMIQCAGSREPNRPYCSRVCCTQAIKNTLKLKQLRPNLNLFVLYRDIRTFGFREAYYQAARDAGIVFLRYELPHKPQVSSFPDHLQITLSEPLTGQNLNLATDLLILSTGIEPQPNGRQALAHTLHLSLDANGFFREEHPKMKPLDLKNPNGAGLYLAGLAHSPRFLEETIAQAQAAALRAAAFLAPPDAHTENAAAADSPTSVWVNPRLCSFCGLCVEACPYQARVMNYDTRVADVDYALCHGCGLCAVVCPNKATLQKAFEHRQLLAAVDMAVA